MQLLVPGTVLRQCTVTPATRALPSPHSRHPSWGLQPLSPPLQRPLYHSSIPLRFPMGQSPLLKGLPKALHGSKNIFLSVAIPLHSLGQDDKYTVILPHQVPGSPANRSTCCHLVEPLHGCIFFVQLSLLCRLHHSIVKYIRHAICLPPKFLDNKNHI